MIANYHTHTYRCHHATGTERGYIKTSIAGGIRYLGFSEHTPLVFSNGTESDHRMYMEDLPNYVNHIRALREEYKDEIDIKIGLEMEYYPTYFKKMLETARDCGIEYLILGQHVLDDNDDIWSVRIGDSEEHLDKYIELVCEAAHTGVFSYIAHPDVINFKGDRELYLRKMRKICELSLETGLPLELNFWGLYNADKHYPAPDFWKMVGEMGCDVVYGCDAHKRSTAFDPSLLARAEEMRETLGLKVIDVPRIIDIQKIDMSEF